MSCAKDICDYLLIFDADDYIVGDIHLNDLRFDGYLLKFGNGKVVYQRKVLVKSSFPWKFNGVLHECIGCEVPTNETLLEGNYHIVSGKTSSRNKNPTKYLDDAKILEKAFVKSLETNDGLFSRYSYYCANSYFDAGNKEQAIKWYKKTLTLNGWFDEKYNSCLALYQLITDESRFYFLVKSFTFNPKRIEGMYELIKYYTCENQFSIAWMYYTLIKDYFEKEYYPSNGDLSSRLFVKTIDYTFFLPYYMIIVCSYVKEWSTGILMLQIIMKHKGYSEEWYINNLFYNLQFYNITESVKRDCLEYISFLKKQGIYPKETSLFKKNILFYTGFSEKPWNLSSSEKYPLGGSERAICYLSQELAKNYNVYIAGDLTPETKNGITFLNRNGIQNLLDTTHFEFIVISRYISFFTLYIPKKYNGIYIMAHDVSLLNNVNGCKKTPNEILLENDSIITGCICLTEWHGNHFKVNYPSLKNIKIINNGICPELFPSGVLKKRNSFIYTSCSSRGLLRLVELWTSILQELPDATLHISSYEPFPITNEDSNIKTIIESFPEIFHHGQLNQKELYSLMATSEYWLYPCSFNETSCITAMEMLMSEVICLYYPIAGLTDTLNGQGIQVSRGTEIETIINLSEKQKKKLRLSGKEYALSCSWENRGKEWCKLFGKKKEWVFYYDLYHTTSIKEYIYNLQNESCNVYLTNDKSFKVNPDEITMILNNFMNGNYNCVPDLTGIKGNVTFLQLEPLNLPHRLECLKRIKEKTTIYDYSLSNIKILNEHGITATHLPYIVKEKEYLSKLFKETKKEYHFGFINKKTSMPITPPRRNKVLAYLFDAGFKINIVSGWGEDRDTELAKCKVILNIHGQINENENPYPEECSNIFEHIRCDRLLESGFEVLSEESYCLEPSFIQRYPNLKIIKYTDFFTLHGTVPLELF